MTLAGLVARVMTLAELVDSMPSLCCRQCFARHSKMSAIALDAAQEHPAGEDCILTDRVIRLAKALNVSALSLAESLAKRLMPVAEKCLAAGAWGVAVVAIPRGDGEWVDLGLVVPSADGRIKIPRGAELVLAFAKTDKTHVGDLADYPILHDSACPTLVTGLMASCRCSPEIGAPSIVGSALEAN